MKTKRSIRVLDGGQLQVARGGFETTSSGGTYTTTTMPSSPYTSGADSDGQGIGPGPVPPGGTGGIVIRR